MMPMQVTQLRLLRTVVSASGFGPAPRRGFSTALQAPYFVKLRDIMEDSARPFDTPARESENPGMEMTPRRCRVGLA